MHRNVVIIGGGYIGVMTAFYLSLASRSNKVTVLEQRNSVACETSYMNGGLLCPSLSMPWTNLGAFKVLFNGLMDPKKSTIKIRPSAFADKVIIS